MEENVLRNELDKCVEHLKNELSQLRTGRASTELLDGIKVEAYGAETPLQGIANVGVADAKTLNIQVWDKTQVEAVAKAIEKANLGLSVSIDGELIRAKLPDLSEERRKELVKVMGERVETARVSARNVRQKFMQEIDAEVEGGVSEDVGDREREVVEKEVKRVNEEIEQIREKKEEELMRV